MGRDVAVEYIKTKVGALPHHKFEALPEVDDDFKTLTQAPPTCKKLNYLLEGSLTTS